jgi:hypothetical protein
VEEGERGTERNGLTERETEHWRVLETAWVVKLTVGIEHLSISINQINRLETILNKGDMNRFWGGSKNMLDCAVTFISLDEASHHNIYWSTRQNLK